MARIEIGEWFPAPGFYACLPDLPAPHNEPHWHPEDHPADHRMGRSPALDPSVRHCMERGCDYLERRKLVLS
jgi:hypothetical protein